MWVERARHSHKRWPCPPVDNPRSISSCAQPSGCAQSFLLGRNLILRYRSRHPRRTRSATFLQRAARGVFHCNYPVPPRTYEVHLLFAETSGLQENSRNVGFSLNGGPPTNLDVVDDAGGDDIATTRVFTDVASATDGTIHVGFATPEAFVNAIEILQGAPHRMLPVRIVVGRFLASSIRDNDVYAGGQIAATLPASLYARG
jgi:hypothetical protein